MFTHSFKVNCLVVLLFTSFYGIFAQIDYETCDKNGIHFYEELGCKPQIIGSQPCPVSYKCKDYIIPNGKCLFYGKELNNGDIADGSYCNKGFECRAEPNSKGTFENLLIIDCFFGPNTDGCYNTGELRRCCQTEFCPTGPVYECQVGNTTYKEDQVFTPEGTCYNCICKPGFRGIYEEPYCIRRPCDMELRSSTQLEKKCAPVYYNDDALCCPAEFLCAEDVTSTTLVTKAPESKSQCTFGSNTYNIGDKIQVVAKNQWSSNIQRTCECIVPPYLACKNYLFIAN